MPKPISGQVSLEYTPGLGVHFPDTARRGRAIQPSFSHTNLVVTHTEPVTISISLGALAANASANISGTQQLAMQSINMAQNDMGTILFAGVSVTAPNHVIVSFPNLSISTNQGNPNGGVLAPGQTYNNLTLSASALCVATSAGSSAGAVTISATALILGTSTG